MNPRGLNPFVYRIGPTLTFSIHPIYQQIQNPQPKKERMRVWVRMRKKKEVMVAREYTTYSFSPHRSFTFIHVPLKESLKVWQFLSSSHIIKSNSLGQQAVTHLSVRCVPLSFLILMAQEKGCAYNGTMRDAKPICFDCILCHSSV